MNAFRLPRGWTGMRLFRLVLAGFFLAAGISNGEPVALFAAGFFGLQAVFNVGCCGSSCAVPGPDGNSTRC
jgi:hypothetical protein